MYHMLKTNFIGFLGVITTIIFLIMYVLCTNASMISVIRSVDHEVEYWENALKFSKGGINKNTSADFKEILEPFAKDFR